MKITVVSPHRDDAAFSLGLSIEHWLGGHRVHILNCFTQCAYAPFSDAETLHPNDRVSFVSAVRKREDAAWNKLLGGKLQFTDLDLFDAPLRLVCTVQEAFTLPIRPGDRAVERIAGAIAKLARNSSAGDLAFLLPLAIGNHIDHRVTQRAGLDALAGSPIPLAFYEDLPYAAMEGNSEGIEALANSTGLDLQPTFAEPATPDPPAHRHRKLRMAECYDSQIDSAVAQQIAGYSADHSGRERLWANAAWRHSALAGPTDTPEGHRQQGTGA